MAARRREGPSPAFQRLAARSKHLAFERNSAQAGPLALAHHLQTRTDMPKRGAQTLDLAAWLPIALVQMRAVLPDYIEVAPLIAAETPHVSCDPAVLEHMLLELVLQATTVLPWGGTVWVTVMADADGQVLLDVLENGHGHVRDLTLRASADAA
jgi:signal transduction histidine kinase